MTNGNVFTDEDLKGEPRDLSSGGADQKPPPDPEETRKQRRMMFFAVIGALVLIALVVLAVWALFSNPAQAAVVRDIFIIFMALETLLIGFTLVVLIVQLARLINLLQNEIKPILDSTNETVSTMRGTVTFLSDNLAEPVVKLSETFAAFGEVRKFFKSVRGK